MLRLTGAQGDEGLGDTAPEALEGIRFLFSLFVYLFCVLFSERLGLGRPKCRLNGCNIVRPLNAWEIEGAKTRVVFSIDLDLIASTYYLLASFCKLYDDWITRMTPVDVQVVLHGEFFRLPGLCSFHRRQTRDPNSLVLDPPPGLVRDFGASDFHTLVLWEYLCGGFVRVGSSQALDTRELHIPIQLALATPMCMLGCLPNRHVLSAPISAKYCFASPLGSISGFKPGCILSLSPVASFSSWLHDRIIQEFTRSMMVFDWTKFLLGAISDMISADVRSLQSRTELWSVRLSFTETQWEPFLEHTVYCTDSSSLDFRWIYIDSRYMISHVNTLTDVDPGWKVSFTLEVERLEAGAHANHHRVIGLN